MNGDIIDTKFHYIKSLGNTQGEAIDDEALIDVIIKETSVDVVTDSEIEPLSPQLIYELNLINTIVQGGEISINDLSYLKTAYVNGTLQPKAEFQFDLNYNIIMAYGVEIIDIEDEEIIDTNTDTMTSEEKLALELALILSLEQGTISENDAAELAQAFNNGTLEPTAMDTYAELLQQQAEEDEIIITITAEEKLAIELALILSLEQGTISENDAAELAQAFNNGTLEPTAMDTYAELLQQQDEEDEIIITLTSEEKLALELALILSLERGTISANDEALLVQAFADGTLEPYAMETYAFNFPDEEKLASELQLISMLEDRTISDYEAIELAQAYSNGTLEAQAMEAYRRYLERLPDISTGLITIEEKLALELALISSLDQGTISSNDAEALAKAFVNGTLEPEAMEAYAYLMQPSDGPSSDFPIPDPVPFPIPVELKLEYELRLISMLEDGTISDDDFATLKQAYYNGTLEPEAMNAFKNYLDVYGIVDEDNGDDINIDIDLNGGEGELSGGGGFGGGFGGGGSTSGTGTGIAGPYLSPASKGIKVAGYTYPYPLIGTAIAGGGAGAAIAYFMKKPRISYYIFIAAGLMLSSAIAFKYWPPKKEIKNVTK